MMVRVRTQLDLRHASYGQMRDSWLGFKAMGAGTLFDRDQFSAL